MNRPKWSYSDPCRSGYPDPYENQGPARPGGAATVAAIDSVARERAEEWVAQLEEALGRASMSLALLGGFLGETPDVAVVDIAETGVAEASAQLSLMRRAIRDLDPDYKPEVAS